MMPKIPSFNRNSSIQQLLSDNNDPQEEKADIPHIGPSRMMPNNPFDMTSSIQQLLVSNSTKASQEEVEADVLLTPEHVKIPDEQVAESIFTKSIAAMTSSDREYAYEDIHAIPHPAKQAEDQETIRQSLERLEAEIEMREDNKAYLLAKLSNPAYVSNQDFRLLFLRSDRFDAKKAAFRMVRHFQMKLELFGKEKLGRDIMQDDFDKDDMKVLNVGAVQLLPTKDRGGRAIILFKNNYMPESDMKRRGRRFFYLLMLAARGAGTNSFVAISYLTDQNVLEVERTNAITDAWVSPTIATGMPIHLAAVHLGYGSSELWAPVESVLKVSSSVEYRIRVRTFQGSVQEWLTSLKGYGIQPEQVPLRDDGTLERSEYQQMMRNHRVKERQFANRNNIVISQIKSPGAFDVLFGKGSRYQDHEGNVKLRRLIADCRKTYDKTKRGEKQSLIQEVVDTVRQSSGLFLKEDGGNHKESSWVLVDDEAAGKKVGALFRSLRAQGSS